jgi:hypothetical protein
VAQDHTSLLQAYNVAANTTEDCDFLYNAVNAWLRSSASVPTSHRFTDEYDDTAFLIWGKLLPVRCSDWQQPDGVITVCPVEDDQPLQLCNVWNVSNRDDVADPTIEMFADAFNLRVGGFRTFARNTTAPADFGNGSTEEEFYVKVIYNGGHYISLVYVSLYDRLLFHCAKASNAFAFSLSLSRQTDVFMLLVTMVALGLFGLTAMRGDAGRLVLDPLQRMLKIVVRCK